MIISISGDIGSGKDLSGRIIQWFLTLDRWIEDPEIEMDAETVQKNKVLFMDDRYGNEYSQSSDVVSSANYVRQQQSRFEVRKWATELRKIAAAILKVPIEHVMREEFKNEILPERWNYWSRAEVKDGVKTGKRILISEDYFKFMSPEAQKEADIKHSQMTGREFLQRLGTDGGRNNVHINIWVNMMMADYTCIDDTRRAWNGTAIDYADCEFPNWIITDTRFPNEVHAVLKKKNSFDLKIFRYPSWFREKYPHLLDLFPHELPKDERVEYVNWRGQQHESETSLDDHTFQYVINNSKDLEHLENQILDILIEKEVVSKRVLSL